MWTRFANTTVGRVLPHRCRVEPSARLLVSHRSSSRRMVSAASTTPSQAVAELTEPDSKVLDILVCPFSKLPLTHDRDARELVSPVGVAYPITASGIPNMMPACARIVAAQSEEH